MATIETWNSFAGWSLWVNESDPSGDQTSLRRLVGSDLKLPFDKIEMTSSTEIARWRFGQNQDLSDDTGNGHTASLQSSAEISEFGLNMPNRNGHATVAELGSFDGLTTTYMLAFWFKSTITNYSDGIGIIAGHTTGSGEGQVEYGLAVNTSNKIIGLVEDGGGVTIKPSVSSLANDVAIDTKWHVVVLSVSSSIAIVNIDNDFTVDQFSLVTPSTVTGSPQFSIGSSQFNTVAGFFGIVDEVSLFEGASGVGTYHRFSANVFLSPVIDTERFSSVMSSIVSEYDAPNGSSVTFAFRSSDTQFNQDDTTLQWTGFTAPEQVTNLTETSVSDLGVFVQGRYHQVKIKLSPSSVNSSVSDPLQTESPTLKSLVINTSPPDLIIHPTEIAYQPGLVLGQIVDFSGTKRIDKVSLNLSVISTDPKDFVVGDFGRVSWSAANFQSSRNEWTFQPIPHWSDDNNWQSSGLTIKNTLQSESYNELEDAVANAPFLSYSFFVPTGGVWDMWGYGSAVDGVWYGIDGDITDLRKLTLGQNISGFSGVPYWTKFGSLFFEEGGIHTFTVYLAGNSDVILDQWLFTLNQGFSTTLSESGSVAFTTPLPISKGPFTTVVRLRSLENGEPVPLVDPPTGSNIVSAYQPSTNINAGGKFNYAVQNTSSGSGVNFEDGIFIEYMQIGGGSEYSASWDYKFV